MSDLDSDADMQDRAAGSELVVIAAVGTMEEALVIRATLQSAGIEAVLDNENTNLNVNWGVGVINPNGYQVRVRARDVEAALGEIDLGHQASVDLEPLSEPFPEDEDIREAARRDSPANFNAQGAYYMAIITLFIWPFFPLTLYLYFQAKQCMSRRPPADPALFRKHISRAAALIWVTIILCALFVLRIALR
jgi:hypothetical protein